MYIGIIRDRGRELEITVSISSHPVSPGVQYQTLIHEHP